MSEPAFEIRCPACGSVVPAEVSGCPNCLPSRVAAADAPEAAKTTPPDLAAMRLKEYHRLVRANYVAVETPRAGARPASSFRLQTYVPFVLLLIGLAVGAALAFGRL